MRNNPSDAYPRWEPWTRCVRWTICRLSVNRQISFHCILRLGVHDDDQCWRYSYWPSGNQTFPSLVQEPFWWWKVASGNPVYTGVKSHALYEFQTSILRVSQRVWAYVAWASLSAKRSFFFWYWYTYLHWKIIERLESENSRTSLFYLFNYSLSLIVKTKAENILVSAFVIVSMLGMSIS